MEVVEEDEMGGKGWETKRPWNEWNKIEVFCSNSEKEAKLVLVHFRFLTMFLERKNSGRRKKKEGEKTNMASVLQSEGNYEGIKRRAWNRTILR